MPSSEWAEGVFEERRSDLASDRFGRTANYDEPANYDGTTRYDVRDRPKNATTSALRSLVEGWRRVVTAYRRCEASGGGGGGDAALAVLACWPTRAFNARPCGCWGNANHRGEARSLSDDAVCHVA